MSWLQFEDLVAAMYQSKGYDVEPRGGLRPDGGIDLIVRKGHLHWIVQCKHYRDDSVGVRALRELLGVVTAAGAAGSAQCPPRSREPRGSWRVECRRAKVDLVRAEGLLPPHNRPTTVTIAALMVGVGRPLRGGS